MYGIIGLCASIKQEKQEKQIFLLQICIRKAILINLKISTFQKQNVSRKALTNPIYQLYEASDQMVACLILRQDVYSENI